MGAEPPRPLADAAAKRSVDAEHRVHSALRELDREGATVTFAVGRGTRTSEPRVSLRLPGRCASRIGDRGGERGLPVEEIGAFVVVGRAQRRLEQLAHDAVGKLPLELPATRAEHAQPARLRQRASGL